MGPVRTRLAVAAILVLIAAACTSGPDSGTADGSPNAESPTASPAEAGATDPADRDPETADDQPDASASADSVVTAGEGSEGSETDAAQPSSPTADPAADSDANEPPTGTFPSCDEAGDFAVLCEAYDILTSEYVDALDPAALADGATTGISEFTDATEAGTGSTGAVCQSPTSDFGQTCDAATAALSEFPVDTVVEAAIQGMLTFGLDDPNTVYLPPEALERIQEENSGQISGIGALVSTEETGPDGESEQCFVISETCRMSIVGLIPNAPAELGGLEVGDVTVEVDGESVLGWTADEVVAAVRGPEGTGVLLGLDRDGELLEFTIVRAPIVIPVTASEILDGNIGYLALSQFTNNSDELLRDELEGLLDQGVTSLILDLRNNPGGALTASVNITSEFLADGLVLRTESPDEDRTYEVTGDGLAADPALEMVVLVNGGSASASEVVSSALQEAGRAIVVGDATFGKNTVQRQFNLSNGGAIKVTIARWVTPEGASFGGDGVIPDVFVEVTPEDVTDLALERAIELLQG